MENLSTCSIRGCSRVRKYAKTGWCQTHYHRWWRSEDRPSAPPEPVAPQIDWWTPASYRTTHARMDQLLGHARLNECVDCGQAAKEWAYDGTDPTEIDGEVSVGGSVYGVKWSRFPEFYKPMCYPCHRKMDKGDWSRRRKTCSRGHPWEGDNIYTCSSGSCCKTCKSDADRKRYYRRKALEVEATCEEV